ncbi:MAG: carboxypeptidase regulatory-like domain-containing protein [Calditrichaeota bacterium]|nr:carboxypeptidase regulatory-like domain-containing protein [Calditrichota bacterium]
MIKKFFFVVVLIFMLFDTGNTLAQKVSDPAVIEGVDYFYKAKFPQAIESLRKAISTGKLPGDDVFAAYLYMAFSQMRQNAPQDSVDKNLVAAIKANPNIEIDGTKTPPDLFERFVAVRKSTLGGLLIVTEPGAASAILMKQDGNKVMTRYTPAQFTNLFSGRYELVIAKDGYKPQTALANVRAGRTDTLLVQLRMKGKSIFKKWWAWGSGLAAATAIVVLQKTGKKGEKEGDLPEPPARPKP